MNYIIFLCSISITTYQTVNYIFSQHIVYYYYSVPEQQQVVRELETIVTYLSAAKQNMQNH